MRSCPRRGSSAPPPIETARRSSGAGPRKHPPAGEHTHPQGKHAPAVGQPPRLRCRDGPQIIGSRRASKHPPWVSLPRLRCREGPQVIGSTARKHSHARRMPQRKRGKGQQGGKCPESGERPAGIRAPWVSRPASDRRPASHREHRPQGKHARAVGHPAAPPIEARARRSSGADARKHAPQGSIPAARSCARRG